MPRPNAAPKHLLPAWLEPEIAASNPDVLLIFHPGYHAWQIYRANLWDAERLYNAMYEHHCVHDRAVKWQWWRWRGAPKLIESLEVAPGSWLIPYLNRTDDGKHPYPGGHAQWLRDFEIEQEAADAKKRANRDEFTKDRLREGALHLRDAHRGDPLAGKRKWVQTSPAAIATDGTVQR